MSCSCFSHCILSCISEHFCCCSLLSLLLFFSLCLLLLWRERSNESSQQFPNHFVSCIVFCLVFRCRFPDCLLSVAPFEFFARLSFHLYFYLLSFQMFPLSLRKALLPLLLQRLLSLLLTLTPHLLSSPSTPFSRTSFWRSFEEHGAVFAHSD